MKGKPFLISAIVFGGLGALILFITVISFFNPTADINKTLEGILHLNPDSLKNETLAQIAVVFFIPAFIFAYRSFTDNLRPSGSHTAVRVNMACATIPDAADSTPVQKNVQSNDTVLQEEPDSQEKPEAQEETSI